MNEKHKQAEPVAILYHTFEDGKYAVSFAGGKLYAFRNGLMWQDLTGDKLIYSMLAEVDLLKNKLAKSDFHPAPTVAHPPADVVRELVEALEMLITNPFREGTNSSNRLIEIAKATLTKAKEHGL